MGGGVGRARPLDPPILVIIDNMQNYQVDSVSQGLLHTER